MNAPSHQSTVSERLRTTWRSRGPAAWCLLPVAGIYALLTCLHKTLYRSGIKKAQHPGVPVIVIGNVIAGGAGKTPTTLATVAHLKNKGLKVGIISRGFGRTPTDCREVHPHSRPQDVGDEPLLLAQHSGVPVFVAPERFIAAQALLEFYANTDVIVCDDGLQHCALARDIEVCVFNDEEIGNGWMLPAGPLREPWPRRVNAVLYSAPTPPQGTPPTTPCFPIKRQLATYALRSTGERVQLSDLQSEPLHAVAAIARPEDFFAMLRAQSLHIVSTEALPDHYNFESWQQPSGIAKHVICTEKDATKLWQTHPNALAVPLQIHVDQGYFDLLDKQLCLSSTP